LGIGGGAGGRQQKDQRENREKKFAHIGVRHNGLAAVYVSITPKINRGSRTAAPDRKSSGRELRCGVFRFIHVVIEDGAGILSLGVLITIDQLNKGHRRIVAVTETRLDNTGIPARAIGIALR